LEELQHIPITKEFIRNVLRELSAVGDFQRLINQTIFDHPDLEAFDKRNVLVDILRCLLILCGSEERSIQWLIRKDGYGEVTGRSPADSLANGNVGAADSLLDWLQILVRYRATCPDLIHDIFRK
jgi:hypothetical protein